MTKPPLSTPLYFLWGFVSVRHILPPFGHIVTGRNFGVAGYAPSGGAAYGHVGGPPLALN